MDTIPTTTSTIPVILGATATGKTDIGIHLAKGIDGEVISIDSRKVYKGLPIGTATPEGEWRNGIYYVQGVPHHLMSFLSPDQTYTAGDFANDAHRLIEDILHRGHVPILVGGTGFYFKALQKGLPRLPPRDPQYRIQLTQRIQTEGHESLHQELSLLDPSAAAAINSRDTHKIIRALEVHHLTGRPFSFWKGQNQMFGLYRFTVMGLNYSREILEQRIRIRSRRMAESGMIEETRALLKQGYKSTCPALSSFGFREAVQVIEGRLPEAEFLSRLIKGTLAYAKRQRTWFRTQVKPVWFDVSSPPKNDEIAMKMRAFLIHPN